MGFSFILNYSANNRLHDLNVSIKDVELNHYLNWLNQNTG